MFTDRNLAKLVGLIVVVSYFISVSFIFSIYGFNDETELAKMSLPFTAIYIIPVYNYFKDNKYNLSAGRKVDMFYGIVIILISTICSFFAIFMPIYYDYNLTMTPEDLRTYYSVVQFGMGGAFSLVMADLFGASSLDENKKRDEN